MPMPRGDLFEQNCVTVIDRRYSSLMATLRIHVVSNAKVDKVVGTHGGAIKIKLRARAVEGNANVALCKFLAEELQLSQRSIVLERGHKSREKMIRVDGLSEEDLRRRLLPINITLIL